MKKGLFALLAILFLGTGCSRDVTFTPFPSPTQSPTPFVTSQPTSTRTPLPSPTPQRSPTRTFTPAPTATPELPALDGSRAPSRREEIDSSNLQSLTEFARWGFGKIRNSSYNPNANILLVQSTERTGLYNVENLEPFLTLYGYLGSAVLSSEGNKFAVVTIEGIQVWDVEQAMMVRTIDYSGNKCLGIHSCDGLRLPHLSFSPDSLYLAALSLPVEPENPNHRELLIWDLSDGSVIRRQRLSDGANSFLYDPTGNYLAVEVEGRIEVLDIQQWLQIYSLQESGAVLGYEFSPDGNQIAIERPQIVRVRRVEDGSVTRTISGPRAVLFDFDLLWSDGLNFSRASLPAGSILAVSPDGMKMIFRTDRDKRLELRTLPDSLLLGNLRLSELATDRVYFTGDSAEIIAVEADGIRKWNSESAVLLRSKIWNAVVTDPIGLMVSSSGHVIVTEKDHWKLMESTDGTSLYSPENPMVLMPSGDIYEIQPNGPHSTLVRVSDGFVLSELRYAGDVHTVNLSENGSYLLTQGEMHSSIQLWEMPAAERVRELYTGNLVSSAFTQVGGLLATTGNVTGSRPNPNLVVIRLWDSASGRLTHSADGVIYRVFAFSPDGISFIADAPNGKLNVYQTSNLAMLRTIDAPEPGIRYTSAAFSLGGDLLFASRGDGMLVGWETTEWNQVLAKQVHNGASFYVDISPDGTSLVTAGVDGTLRLWGIWP